MSQARRKRLDIRLVSKVFGSNVDDALALLRANETKDAIHGRCGAVVALKDVSFDVDEGEILVVMGLSGSGKSTLLRCLNRLVEPSCGEILIDGTDVMKLGHKELLEFRRHKLGMVFQHFALFPHRTILENVEYGLEVQGVEKKKRRDQAMNAIEVVGLKGWEQKYPRQLSGGMQQRAGLARALAVNADILLMDEAFSALDPLIRRDMQSELRQLQQRLRKTIVFVSHDLDEAIALGGRIVLMKDGEIVQVGTPEDILTAPATTYVERFVEHIDVASVITAGRVADRSQPALRTVGKAAGARVAAEQPLKAVLPVIAAHGSVSVVDEEGAVIGVITPECVVGALGRRRDGVTYLGPRPVPAAAGAGTLGA